MKKAILLFITILIITGCKSVTQKNENIEGKIIFKNMINESEKVDSVSISGLFRISGVKEIPAGYVQFESFGNLKEQNLSFKISFLKKPIMEIIAENQNIIFINHSGKQFIRLNIENIDFTKFIGVNFNPLEISYLVLGLIPYSKDMALMDYKWQKKEYIMEITSNTSKYTLYLNKSAEFSKVVINNEYYDSLILNSIQYTKNDDGVNIPKTVNFVTEDEKIKLSFIINQSSFKPVKSLSFDPSLLNDYKEVFDINDIKVKLN